MHALVDLASCVLSPGSSVLLATEIMIKECRGSSEAPNTLFCVVVPAHASFGCGVQAERHAFLSPTSYSASPPPSARESMIMHHGHDARMAALHRCCYICNDPQSTSDRASVQLGLGGGCGPHPLLQPQPLSCEESDPCVVLSLVSCFLFFVTDCFPLCMLELHRRPTHRGHLRASRLRAQGGKRRVTPCWRGGMPGARVMPRRNRIGLRRGRQQGTGHPLDSRAITGESHPQP